VALVLTILVGVIIYATLMDPVWAHHKQAAAGKAYEQLSISGSVHRARLHKRDAYGDVRYRVTIKATVMNSDKEDHQVNVCVDNCLVYLPDDPHSVWHVQDRVRAHKSFTFHWSTVTIDSSFHPKGRPHINSVDGVRVHQ
jgi:hypothetical protein